MKTHILVIVFILVSFAPIVKTLPDWTDPLRFWDSKQESAWEKAWSSSLSTAYYIWEMWYNQVMVSKATTLLGQTGITLLALAMTCFLVYKLTKAIGGRHRTPLQNTGAPQANSSVVHVHNAVQFREEPRGSHTRDRVSKIVVPLEKYNDSMSIEAWLTRLELHLEPELDKEDWARDPKAVI